MERKLTFICVRRCWGRQMHSLAHKHSNISTFTIHRIFIIRSVRFQSKSLSYRSKKKPKFGLFCRSRTLGRRGRGVQCVYLDILFPNVDELEHNKSIKNWWWRCSYSVKRFILLYLPLVQLDHLTISLSLSRIRSLSYFHSKRKLKQTTQPI